MPLEPGSRLGPYEIVSPIGAGGMGEVYRARDPRLGRDVAVKILPEAASADAERLRRFDREARAVAALSHPNVLAIFDVGSAGVPFLVTELLEGETLRALLARGPLSAARTVELGLQLAAGLEAAHARGLVHRDLKPENLFITTTGPMKILDFGLARQIDRGAVDELATHTATQHGLVVGTLGYMAPEQLRGQPVDHRADLFAAGAVLFEMLTGRRAFAAPTAADTVSAILTLPAEALPFAGDTPPALAGAIRRCLEKEPARRFASARELASALASYSEAGLTPVSVRPAPATATVAVLPFSNLSADPEQQYFSEGLAEELIDALTRIAGLRVASRTSSFRFRARDTDVREIGAALGVGAVVEGSVRRAGDRIRVTAQLTGTADGYHLWAGRFDRELRDVFAIQDEIVEAIVTALAPALLGEARGAARRPTENLQAYELYLRGRYFWNQRSPAVMGAAIRSFEEAIALDPDYALAYAGLADCYSILRVYGWTPAEHSQPRALEAVIAALARDPALPEARFSQALYTFHFEPGWRQARGGFEAAIAASPRNGTFAAYYGLFLAAEYEQVEARRRIEQAIALEPHSPIVHFLAACAACAMQDVELAERHVAAALSLQPDSLGPRWPETVGHLQAGRMNEALAAAERVIARTRAPIYLGVLGMVYGCTGRLADARALWRELDERESRGEYVTPAARLSIALGLSDVPGIRAALTACADGGAAPFSVLATGRWLLEAHRRDAEIDRLLDRVHDGARPDTTRHPIVRMPHDGP